MATIQAEIEAFERIRMTLEIEHKGQWILLHDGQLIGAFESFELAADDAVRKFGRGPYLIRQVGVSPAPLPISVVFAWPNAQR